MNLLGVFSSHGTLLGVFSDPKAANLFELAVRAESMKYTGSVGNSETRPISMVDIDRAWLNIKSEKNA